MPNLPSTENSKKELLESIAGEVPVLGSAVKAIQQFRIEEQNKRFNQFIEHSGIDDSYILTLKDNPAQKALVLEYVETVLNTPLPEICVALALIIKSDKGDSYKSIVSQSLKGLSFGSLNVFMKTMKHHENQNRGLEYFQRPKTVDPLSIGLEKEIEEVEVLTRDLVQRNIFSSDQDIDGIAYPVTVTSYSEYIYEKLKLARKICNGTS